MTTDRTDTALLSERHGVPIWLIERSAAARAKASQLTLEAVLSEWVSREGATVESLEQADRQQPTADSPEVAASDQMPATSQQGGGGPTLSGAALLTAVAQARGMPESIIERSANARAGAAGVSLDDVLHEWAQEEGLEAPGDQPPPASPKPTTSSPLPTPKPKAKPAVSVGSGLTAAALLTAVAEARGMPESLVERSAKARAKKTDSTVEDVLNEWAEEAGLATAGDQPPAAVPIEAVALEDVQDDSQTSDGDVQEADAAAEPIPRQARSWRHAMAVGAITTLVPLVILVTFAVFADVPASLSDAPWYLLGLEPFLGYLEPFIALVIVPGVTLSSLLILTVVAWNPAVHPSTRRLALMTLVILILAIGTLTIVGALQA